VLFRTLADPTRRALFEQAYQGAKGGWQQFFAALEQVLARID
jgi:hypothetical protein